jgi:hypothetical protein
MVKLLLSFGAEINLQDTEGNTALHVAGEAVTLSYISIFPLLIFQFSAVSARGVPVSHIKGSQSICSESER